MTAVPGGSSDQGPSSSPEVTRGDVTPKATGTHSPVANQAWSSDYATGMDSKNPESYKTKKLQGRNDARPRTNIQGYPQKSGPKFELILFHDYYG